MPYDYEYRYYFESIYVVHIGYRYIFFASSCTVDEINYYSLFKLGRFRLQAIKRWLNAPTPAPHT